MSRVRTRFAPSPTGYMHIGGMRTALFNWLFARHHGGTFVLRIDDTDQQRNLDEALGPILHAFRWLGLNWDEGPEVGGPFGPYFQSQRFDRYRAAADQLLTTGAAYRDYETLDEIKAQRAQAETEGRQYTSSRRDAGLSAADRRRLEEQGRTSVVRLLIPRDRKVVIDDAVRGRVEWDCAAMPDPVLLRSDGSPLYNFATVIDDVQMEISHVIRAEEHLSNTPVQALVYQALGATLPQFAHVPYVAAPASKEKLSKRKVGEYRRKPEFKRMFDDADRVFPRIGLDPQAVDLSPVMVEFYERIGFLPQGVLNALSRLGWSLDDRTEILPLDMMVQHFTLDRVVKSPAGFDPDKLYSFQQHWMQQLPLDGRINGCLPYLAAAGLVESAECGMRNAEWKAEDSGDRIQDSVSSIPHSALRTPHSDRSAFRTPHSRADVGRVLAAMGERLTLLSDVLNFDEFFLPDDRLPYDEKAFDKRLRAPGAADRLRRFRDRLATADPFEPPRLEELMKSFAESEGIKLADIIHPVRLATTGKSTGVGMFDALALLGRDACLHRIDRALERI